VCALKRQKHTKKNLNFYLTGGDKAPKCIKKRICFYFLTGSQIETRKILSNLRKFENFE